MREFHAKENSCELVFLQLGDCYHLWTPENHEIIFTNDADFRFGMNAIGISARLFPEVRILTFELMSNHIHIAAAARKDRLLLLFDSFTALILKWLKSEGRHISLKSFQPGLRQLTSLDELRNVIVYDNRNGYVISQHHTPFTYPWGANRYYYSPDTCQLAMLLSKKLSLRERRRISHSRIADNAEGLLLFEDCAMPLSFCDISTGESLFRNATQYFSKISKSIESSREIAKEIGESVWYTDDELYSIVRKISQEQYNIHSPSQLPSPAKIDLAKTLRYDYNASQKQILRMLKVDKVILQSLGITR